MPHIEARDITLNYDTPAGVVAGVRGVNFAMEASEFLCIVGPSGCGKSTLLNIIAGFLAPSAGEIRVAGQQVSGYGMDRGVVFQDFAQLFPWRTALGNVAFGDDRSAAAARSAERRVSRLSEEAVASARPEDRTGLRRPRLAA